MRYVPILKSKPAELKALQDLAPEIKSQILPFIDLLPPQKDELADAWLEKVTTNLARSWPAELPLIVDGGSIAAARTSTGEAALLKLWHLCQAQGVGFTPVTSPSRLEAHQAAIQGIVRDRACGGLCLRLSGSDFDYDFPASPLTDLLRFLRVKETDADLLLDFGALSAGPVALLMRAYIESIPNLMAWRSVTVSSTAFPRDLSHFSPDSVNRVPRTDWKAWRSLCSRPLKRSPDFSDYAIQHPDLIDFDPKVMTMSAGLRYAAEEHWVIVKGRGLKKHKAATQMHKLCAKLVALPEYKGPDFSIGDKWIKDCAESRATHGNSMVWRRMGTGHHLTLTAHQVANVGVP